MRRYVVLEIPYSPKIISWLAKRFKVVGVYVKPTRFCECPEKQRRNLSNWVRGSKHGIWVCRACRRPSPAWNNVTPRLELALGKDTGER